MKRRQFITLLGSASAWPLVVRAQQGERVRRMGVLMGYAAGDPEAQVRINVFQEGLAKLGWLIGRNILIDYRWSAADPDRMQIYAAELVGLKPDLILAQSGQVLTTLQRTSREIPIVFVQQADPVELGFVATLARPGGNITGFNSFESSIGGKWLEVLKEVAPHITRVAPILNPLNVSSPGYLRAIEAAARSLGVEVVRLSVSDATEIDSEIETFARRSGGGLIVMPGPFTGRHRDRIIRLAESHRLPAVYPFRYFVANGGLVSYGVDQVDQWRRSVSYVDLILKGAKPAELPVQQPTKYELVVNLRTAKALGLDMPPMLRARVDEVIE